MTDHTGFLEAGDGSPEASKRSDRVTPHGAPLAPLAGRPTVDTVLDRFVSVAAGKGLAVHSCNL